MHLAHTLIQRLFQKTSKYWNIEIKPPTMKYWKIDYLASTNVAMIATSYNIEMTVTWPDLSKALPYSLFLAKDKRWNNIQQEWIMRTCIRRKKLHLLSKKTICISISVYAPSIWCSDPISVKESQIEEKIIPLPPDLPKVKHKTKLG